MEANDRPASDPARNQASHLLARTVSRLRARAARVAFARGALRGAFYIALVAAAALLFFPRIPLGALAIAWLAAALATGLVAAVVTLPGAREAAKRGDDAAGLKDRITSALDLAGERGPMVEALVAEAVDAGAKLQPARVYPLRVPREGWLVPLPLCLCAAAILFPLWRSAGAATPPELSEALAPRLAQLKDFVAREKARDPSPEQKDLLAELERIQSELSQSDLQKKDALAKIAELAQGLQKEQKDLEEKKLDLEKLVKAAQKNDMTRDLAEEVNRGEWQDAAARLSELIDKLEKELKKAREEKADPKKLEELEKQLEELKEMKANLMKLMNVNYDIQARSKVLEFLEAVEGELGAIPDPKVIDGRFLKLGKCQGQCKPKDIVKTKTRCLVKTDKWGKGTIEDFFGEEVRHPGEKEEHKQTVRESQGRSSFTQTQVADDGSRSRLSEREVLAAEKRAAEDTIQRQEIPAGYRDYIRRYFDGIQPDRGAASEEAPAAEGAGEAKQGK